MRTAFIVRPFGPRTVLDRDGKELTIDFDRVERDLIIPAFKAVGLQGGTTVEIAQAGNIREDMFQFLVTRDVVVADLSIHNANVFYELGVRHATRSARTFLLRCDAQEVPFDLRTDRYLEYPANEPEKALPALIAGLRATLASDDTDSPVLKLLTRLPPTDWARLLSVPADFREEVRRAEREGRRGDLRLLACEAQHLPWAMEGLRAVGAAQFDLGDHDGARTTWEAVRAYGPDDVEANTRLATSYQKLKDLTRSNEAVDRVIRNRDVRGPELAEALSLRGSNEKERWIGAWKARPEGDERRREALRSPFLKQAYEFYERGFGEDLNHFYSGFNALALLNVWRELARDYPDVWLDTALVEEDEAELKLRKMERDAEHMAAAVSLALKTHERRAEFEGKPDPWLKITMADLACVTAARPGVVVQRYREGLAAAGEFAFSVVRRQVDLYRGLGVMAESTAAVVKLLDELEKPGAPGGAGPTRAIVFTGHRVDAPDRAQPRFPAAAEARAREMIRAAVQAEVAAAAGPVIGIAGAASGGDILFHEVCAELGVETQLFLVMSRADYVRESVANGGPRWVERFDALFASRPYRFLGNSDHALELPRWLRPWKEYSVWNRSNLWMLHNALAYGSGRVTLVALWNGRGGDGPGGTRDMVEAAREWGVKPVILNAAALLDP